MLQELFRKNGVFARFDRPSPHSQFSPIAQKRALYARNRISVCRIKVAVSAVKRPMVFQRDEEFTQSTTAWTPLTFLKTTEALRWLKDYTFTLSAALCLVIGSHLIGFFSKRRERRSGGIHGEGDGAEDSGVDEYIRTETSWKEL